MITAKSCLGCDDTEVYNACVEIRKKVFIDEQNVPFELEMDGTDDDCIHLLVYDSDQPAATGRLRFDGERVFLSRLAVLKEFRGKKYGDFAARLLIRKAFDGGWERQYVHAQTNAVKFYEKLGFSALGDEFMEAGIKHIEMVHVGDV